MAAGGPNPMSDLLNTHANCIKLEEMLCHEIHNVMSNLEGMLQRQTGVNPREATIRKTDQLYSALAGGLDKEICKGNIELVQDSEEVPNHCLAVLMRLQGPNIATKLQLIDMLRKGCVLWDSEYIVYRTAGQMHWNGGAFLKICLIFMQVCVLQFKHCTDPADDTAVVCILLSHYECQDLPNSEGKTKEEISKYLCHMKPTKDCNGNTKNVHVVNKDNPSWNYLVRTFELCLQTGVTVISYEKTPGGEFDRFRLHAGDSIPTSLCNKLLKADMMKLAGKLFPDLKKLGMEFVAPKVQCRLVPVNWNEVVKKIETASFDITTTKFWDKIAERCRLDVVALCCLFMHALSNLDKNQKHLEATVDVLKSDAAAGGASQGTKRRRDSGEGAAAPRADAPRADAPRADAPAAAPRAVASPDDDVVDVTPTTREEPVIIPD